MCSRRICVIDLVAVFVLCSSGNGHRYLKQTGNDVTISVSSIAVADGTASGESTSATSTARLHAGVSNLSNTSITMGTMVVEAKTTDEQNNVTSRADALFRVDNTTEVGNLMYEALTNQTNNGSSAQAVGLMIDTAVSQQGCESISVPLTQMWLLAQEYNKTQIVDTILQNNLRACACMEYTIKPQVVLFQSRTLLLYHRFAIV
eukprot:TRINITY_DN24549_c0_g1_i1.p3 TRINITY_DN24549_c0_g1~~TRINITY_DN24549_c0_g1_i1.p3  ORF type:complete len:204 (-),score=-1.74 TRINITY_DN24549_c0_g1_i1:545-1156(-)